MEQMLTVADLRPDPTFAAFNTEWPYCLDTGLLTRAGFLERAGAELRRAQRYERSLALVRVSPLATEIDDEGFEHLVFFVQESVRDGIDLAGLIAPRTIMLLLPETNMMGAMDSRCACATWPMPAAPRASRILRPVRPSCGKTMKA